MLDTIEDEIKSLSLSHETLVRHNEAALHTGAITNSGYYHVTIVTSHLRKAVQAAKDAYKVIDELESE